MIPNLAPDFTATLDQCQANMREFFHVSGVDFDDADIRDAIGAAFAYMGHAIGNEESLKVAGVAVVALRWS